MNLLKETSIVQRFSEGEVIISEGIISNNAYIVLKGEVRITKKIDKKTLVLGTLKEGDVFGEMGLITKSVRSATVSALGEVEVGFIDKKKFDELLSTLPEDLQAIVKGLVEKLRRTTDVLTKIGSELENTRKSIKPV
ncbi:MAG: cyclic nucleotide-binding domain-containing protein [Nitrospinae bacterium]|jgi:CRP/FNR family transcriptional regulator, cyclic AMP receptor protein|nr:cyclic nucleotide-binding domain-containing protein [Nitrospinota bacterium]MDA1108940.1 cyclic nucleotide-binding domain-containing protein [Nitrospinota bacterium]